MKSAIIRAYKKNIINSIIYPRVLSLKIKEILQWNKKKGKDYRDRRRSK